ncbi:MAG: hypothetical protein CL967_04420 [Euryarchaeota archaeon]|nr:hypothetical protein [Euryarchaeota archaeon]
MEGVVFTPEGDIVDPTDPDIVARMNGEVSAASAKASAEASAEANAEARRAFIEHTFRIDSRSKALTYPLIRCLGREIIVILDLDLCLSPVSISSEKDASKVYPEVREACRMTTKQSHEYHHRVKTQVLEPLLNNEHASVVVVTRNSYQNAQWQLQELFEVPTDFIGIIAFPNTQASKTELLNYCLVEGKSHIPYGVPERIIIMVDDSKKELDNAKANHKVQVERIPRGVPYREEKDGVPGHGIGNQPTAIQQLMDAVAKAIAHKATRKATRKATHKDTHKATRKAKKRKLL